MKHTILGAGGVIANLLSEELQNKGKTVCLVSRKPKPVTGKEELFSADLTKAGSFDKAMEGAEVAYLVVGIPYEATIWEAVWPVVMRNVIDSAIKHGTKLVFFDNIYMYDPSALGNLTEETPYKPNSRKGEVRAQIATMLQEAMASGKITACIARSADFYGYKAENSFFRSTVVDRLMAGKTPQWLLTDTPVHALTYAPDAAKGTAILGCSDNAWGEVWHLPTADSLPGKEIVALACKAWGSEYGIQVLPSWLLNILALFTSPLREVKEMGYQFQLDYRLNSSKMERVFHLKPMPIAEGIAEMAAAYKKEK